MLQHLRGQNTKIDFKCDVPLSGYCRIVLPVLAQCTDVASGLMASKTVVPAITVMLKRNI